MRWPAPARIFKLSLRIFAGALAGFFLFVLAANLWVLHCGNSRLSASLEALPNNQAGLVLGTSPRLGRAKNRFFEGRMDTAAQLYKAGKVRQLLLSGDNRRKDYNEPLAMRAALIRRGVPESALTLDYAGFRTLDSMARARTVFGYPRITVITDGFHQPRALFLATRFGLDANGFASANVPLRYSLKTVVREWGARVKACLDVYLWKTQPHFGARETPP